ncbi:MAG: hypothetical protein V2B16_10910 [bacterium]
MAGLINLIIYDVLGFEIRTLINEYQNLGEYCHNFNATCLAGVVYINKLSSKTFKDFK